MPNYFREEADTQLVGGGYGRYGYDGGGGLGGLGGVGALIALVVVVAVLWFLGRESHDNNGYNGGCNMPYPYPPYPYPPYGGSNCCSPLDCKIPMAPDMSNCEVDKDLWKVDADVWKSACETQRVVTQGDQAILDKLCSQETQALRDKLAESYAEKSSLESRYFTEKKFGEIEALMCRYDGQVDRQFAGVQAALANIKCDMPVKQPIFWDGIACNTHHIDCDDRHNFPRRRDYGCDCGCN